MIMVIGHKQQKLVLLKMISSGNIPHAFLFSGITSLGKKKLAIEFLKNLNCSSAKSPCGHCKNCLDIEKGLHPDVHLIESLDQEISISEIRLLQKKLSLTSHSAPLKGAVIDNAHLMNKIAQDALLKTLEEPTGRSVIILVSHLPEMISSTILSRVVKISFFRVNNNDIKKELNNESEKIDELIKISDGRPGRIIELLTNPQKIKIEEKIIKEFKEKVLLSNNFITKFEYAKKISLNEKENLIKIIEIWMKYLREILTDKFSKESNSLIKTKNKINYIQQAYYFLTETNTNSKIILEELFLKI